MINEKQKLNQNLFEDDVFLDSIRAGFGAGLLEAGKADLNVVALCADLTESTKTDRFAKEFPDRFIQVGIGEQSMASVASGLASMGKVPFMVSYAMFSPGRNWEQIRTTVAYNNQNVKIVGAHAGVSVGPDGGTHQAIEDMALMRIIPKMTVLSPCDSIEAKKATVEAAKTKGPVYIRLARENSPQITTEDTPFVIGKAATFYIPEGKPDVGIIATGALVHKALRVAKELEGEGVRARVLNVSCIKPLDEDAIVSLAGEAGALVTVEEHQVKGGLGSAVAECLSLHIPVPIDFIGVQDLFGQSGEPHELLSHYGMDESSIKQAVTRVLKRKTRS
jgi:transketolase